MSQAKDKDNFDTNIDIGYIVILLNERKTRNTWRFARVPKVLGSHEISF